MELLHLPTFTLAALTLIVLITALCICTRAAFDQEAARFQPKHRRRLFH